MFSIKQFCHLIRRLIVWQFCALVPPSNTLVFEGPYSLCIWGSLCVGLQGKCSVCPALSPAPKRHYFGGFVPANLDQLSGVDRNFNDNSPLGPMIIVLLSTKIFIASCSRELCYQESK